MAIVYTVLQSLLILLFLLVGGSKLAGTKQQVEAFQHLGLPQWFRVVTGIVQWIGAAGLIAGYWYPGLVAWAGLWLAVTMLLGFLAHLRAYDPIGKAMPALVLAIVAAVLVFAHADGLLNPLA